MVRHEKIIMQEEGFELRLARRERQVAALAADGLTDKAIASRLGIKQGTVDTYWARMRRKSGIESRTEIVARILAAEAEGANQELREEIDRLTTQVAELTARHALDDKPYRDVVEALPKALIVSAVDLQILIANLEAHKVLGYTPFDLVGQQVDVLEPARTRPRISKGIRDIFIEPPGHPKVAHIKAFCVRKDGKEIRAATSVSAVNTSRGLLICAVLTPIGEDDPFSPTVFIRGQRAERLQAVVQQSAPEGAKRTRK